MKLEDGDRRTEFLPACVAWNAGGESIPDKRGYVHIAQRLNTVR